MRGGYRAYLRSPSGDGDRDSAFARRRSHFMRYAARRLLKAENNMDERTYQTATMRGGLRRNLGRYVNRVTGGGGLGASCGRAPS